LPERANSENAKKVRKPKLSVPEQRKALVDAAKEESQREKE
jgi:hypothetical protein